MPLREGDGAPGKLISGAASAAPPAIFGFIVPSAAAAKHANENGLRSAAHLARIARGWFRWAGLYAILYSPTLVATNAGLIRALVLVGVFAALLSTGRAGKVGARVPIRGAAVCVYLVVALAFSQSLALFRGSDTFIGSLMISVLTGVLPLTYLIIRAVPYNEAALPLIASSAAWLGALQASLILADWWSPSIREVFSLIVVQPESLDVGFRAAGLTSMTGDGLSVSQAVCGVCAMYLATDAERWRSATVWALILGLILCTMVFVGRTGFVLVAVFGAFLLVFERRRRRLIAGLAFVLLLFLGGVWLMSVSIDDAHLAELFRRAVDSAFEAAIGFGEGEGFRTASTDDLRSMIVVPDSVSGWLIGYGFYADPVNPHVNYMGTDIGYLRILFYVGLLGSAAIYSWYILAAAWSFSMSSRSRDRVFCAGLIACFLVSQIKFSFLLLVAPLGFTLLVFFAAWRDRARCA